MQRALSLVARQHLVREPAPSSGSRERRSRAVRAHRSRARRRCAAGSTRCGGRAERGELPGSEPASERSRTRATSGAERTSSTASSSGARQARGCAALERTPRALQRPEPGALLIVFLRVISGKYRLCLAYSANRGPYPDRRIRLIPLLALAIVLFAAHSPWVRRGQQGIAGGQTGLRPFTDMNKVPPRGSSAACTRLARTSPPRMHRQRGLEAARRVRPIRGRIGVVGVGMSNAMTEFAAFAKAAAQDPATSRSLTFVEGVGRRLGRDPDLWAEGLSIDEPRRPHSARGHAARSRSSG